MRKMMPEPVARQKRTGATDIDVVYGMSAHNAAIT